MQLSPDTGPKYSLNALRLKNSIYLTTCLPEFISLTKFDPRNMPFQPYLNPVYNVNNELISLGHTVLLNYQIKISKYVFL